MRLEAARAVAEVLWNYAGVVDLVKIPTLSVSEEMIVDDTFDDCPIGHPLLGSDGALRLPTIRSLVKRDQKVRARCFSVPMVRVNVTVAEKRGAPSDSSMCITFSASRKATACGTAWRCAPTAIEKHTSHQSKTRSTPH